MLELFRFSNGGFSFEFSSFEWNLESEEEIIKLHALLMLSLCVF